MNATTALSVSQLNFYVKSVLESDRNLKSVWIRGELCNFVRNAKSGHCYFSLRDPSASVKGVMFQWSASRLTFVPQSGQQVLIFGKVTVYERDGQYQICAEQMIPDGEGRAYLEFLRLKSQLESEGLFERKLPLPSFPRKIGVCTSTTGAAVRDVISVCRRLAPGVSIAIYPCLMQGAETANSVLRALEYFSSSDVQTVIIARGGGSYEDLSAFNDETLARAVAAYPLPVISAVGHETDVTILDFVASYRAATPSVAAEAAVGRIPMLRERYRTVCDSVRKAILSRVRWEEERLRALSARIVPERICEFHAQRLDSLSHRADTALVRNLQRAEDSFRAVNLRLAALNPLAVLGRGFAVAEKDGVAIRSRSDLKSGDRFDLMFRDGGFVCVAECEKNADI